MAKEGIVSLSLLHTQSFKTVAAIVTRPAVREEFNQTGFEIHVRRYCDLTKLNAYAAKIAHWGKNRSLPLYPSGKDESIDFTGFLHACNG